MKRRSEVRKLIRAMLALLCIGSCHAMGQSPPQADRPPEVWSIVVGIDDYTHPGLPDSRTAVRNAQRIRRSIQRTGWSDRHQLLLTDGGSAEPGELAAPAVNILPNRTNLKWAFEQWLAKSSRAGDMVVFYFAGESRCVAKGEGTQLDVRHCLLPVDADPAKLERTGWSLEEAVDNCIRNKFRVVCWLATAPGDPPSGSPMIPSAPAGEVGTHAKWSPGVAWLSRLARWPGVTAWLASAGPRPSTAGKAVDPGDVFTQALLQSLGASGPAPKGDRRPNLAACLKELNQDPRLQLQGFCSLGGVPPSMTLWPSEKEDAEPRPELVIQTGHADKVMAMAFPADGRQVVTAAMDSTVRVWSAPDRSLLRVLPGQTVGVTALALTRNDRWLISGGGRGAVLVYDRQKDFRLMPMAAGQPHVSGIRQIALLPDGLHFVSVDADGRSFLWDPSQTPLSPQPWLVDVYCREIAVGGRIDPDGHDTSFVAARCSDGTVRIFDSTGGGGTTRSLARPDPAAIAVSIDGGLLAAGYDDGQVIIENVKNGTKEEYKAAERQAAVRQLLFSPAGLLAIGHKDGVRLVGPPANPPARGAGVGNTRAVFDLIDRPPQHMVFSPGGEYLAACTEEIGAVRVWRIGGDRSPTVVLDDPSAQAFMLGITGNSRGLAIADFSGGLAFRPFNPQGDEAPWTFPAHRGKIQQLSATPDRQLLLFLDEQRGARIWDLKERTCRRLPGTYSAGAFMDDKRLVLIPDSNAAENSGRLVLANREGNRDASPFFAVRADKFVIPESVPFARVAVSNDGRQLAAAVDPAKEPMVCVWETKEGQLTHRISAARLEDAVLAMAFSSDGRYLLTGGESASARLWDLSAPPGELMAPVVTFSDPGVQANVTAVAIRPGHLEQVVTGHSDGQVHVWKCDVKQAAGALDIPRLVAREFTTSVKALAFTPDGGYLAASGDGKRIWVGAMDPRPHRVDILEGLGPHHDEQINSLIAWRALDAAGRDRPILISGSDDTTIRLWDLEEKALRGTFCAGNRPALPGALQTQELDWVLYTPQGLFDASAEATKLVHYRRPAPQRAVAGRDRGREQGTLSVGLRTLDEAGQLDQLAATHNVYGLGEDLIRGRVPGLKPKSDEPPPISIVAPPRTDPTRADARLTISLGAGDFQDVRLYHNDVPVPCGWDPGVKRQPEAGSLNVDVPVTLVSGSNRFYVMGSRKDAYDSCSRVVEIDYEAPMKRGQVHVLALGVKDYQRRSLRYAEDDADQLSEFLHRRGLDGAGQQGIARVLHGADISRKNVDQVFDEIARRVEDRPQDTVVVFLAGHTGVFDPQRFCLLLPTYPFPEEEPIQVAARGTAPNVGENDKVDPRFVLPYSVIESNLARLNALNRLVIVDACQAESILDDPRVRAIRKWMELSSRRARTSYLMAARRGEPALEVGRLAHGLFTYSLLRGMRAVKPADEPKEVAALALPSDADLNRDGIISTDELDAYARQVLPRLSNIFPQLTGRREGVAPREARGGPTPKAAAAQPLDQALRLQGNEASFPLIPIGEP